MVLNLTNNKKYNCTYYCKCNKLIEMYKFNKFGFLFQEVK